MKYGLQLFSVRDITERDLEGAIAQVARLGYGSVEFAGFFGRSAEQIRQALDGCNIEIFGTHTPLGELVCDFDKTLQYHKAIGNKNFIIPCHDLSSMEKINEFVALVNKYQPMLEAEGIRLSYHNHSTEFIPNADGSHIYNELVERTRLWLEIDTYWAYNAGLDPVQTMQRYRDRLTCIHLKDGVENGAGRPLGRGAAPVEAVYKKAVELNVPIIVESETLTPSGIDEARICIDYLKAIESK